MAKRPTFRDEISTWSAEKRIKIAKTKVEKLTYTLQDVLELHAANEIIQYSEDLAGQIPVSLAAHAFTSFQDAQFKFEIIRLAALWDRAGDNVISIPAVIELIDSPDVVQKLVDDTYNAFANVPHGHVNPHNDPLVQKQIDEVMSASERDFAKSQSEKAAKKLAESISAAKEIIIREETTALRNLRDYASHSLTVTRRDTNVETPAMKYGEETRLLNATIELVEDLYCWVNGRSFDIAGDCFEQARRHAKELWGNCRFEVPHRE